jgi:acyl-CoA synthetase (AMP-forming)/AMP-acid ligase II
MPLSTAYTAHELGRAIRRADIDTLLVPPTLLGRDELATLEEALAGLEDCGPGTLHLPGAPYLRRIWVTGPCDRPWGVSVDLGDDTPSLPPGLLDGIESEIVPADWFVTIQTSGSTAEPKAVIHTHGAVMRRTAQGGLGTGPGVVYAGMPFFWVGGILTLGGALAVGTTMLCQERFDPGAALDLMERERATSVAVWITVLHALRTHPSLPGRDLEPIALLESAPPGSSPAYGIPLGMTESMGPYLDVPSPQHGPEPAEHLRGSNGVARDGYETKLVDPATGFDIEGDGEGEMCIRGYAVTVGNYKREREQVFDIDGWFHTGDRVARREGLYFFTGRITEMIKTAGANVAPPEVEVALESLPGVWHAFVVGVPHAERGEVVAAVVVPHTGTTVDLDAVREGAAKLLSGYKVPRVLLALEEDQVPWLATGKPDKLTMRKLLTTVPPR